MTFTKEVLSAGLVTSTKWASRSQEAGVEVASELAWMSVEPLPVKRFPERRVGREPRQALPCGTEHRVL